MIGKYGSDTYIIDNVGDTVFEEYAYYDSDTVLSPFTYTLGAYVENLTLRGMRIPTVPAMNSTMF